MKNIFLRICFFTAITLGGNVTAQQTDCKYSVEDKTVGQELRTTPDYLMHEYSFGGTSQFLFFSLSNSQGIPVVNFQLLSKSKDFSKVYCLEKDSRIYIQLANNKIVTLFNAGEGDCATSMYDEAEKNNIKALTGNFLFIKGALEDLESSPISFIRVKYVGEMVDYPVNSEIKSETMKQTFRPDRYFIENLKCVK